MLLDWILTLPARLTAAALAVIALAVVLFLGAALVRYGGDNPGTFAEWADVIVGQVMRFIGWLVGLFGQLG